MSELKPCPFCGGKAELTHERDSFLNFAIYSAIMCSKCGVKSPRFQQKCATASDEEAAKAWNRRVSE